MTGGKGAIRASDTGGRVTLSSTVTVSLPIVSLRATNVPSSSWLEALRPSYGVHGIEPTAATSILVTWSPIASGGKSVFPQAIVALMAGTSKAVRTSSFGTSPCPTAFVPCW